MKTDPMSPLDGSMLTGALALVGCGLLLVLIICLAPFIRPRECWRAFRTFAEITKP